MSMFENKPMTILIAVNIVALMIIFWLIGLLMGRDNPAPQAAIAPVPQVAQPATPHRPQPQPQQQAATAQYRAPTQTSTQPAVKATTPAANNLQQRAASLVGNLGFDAAQAAPAEPVIEEPVMVERYTTIDVFYDGAIAHVEKTDDSGNRTISISNNLKEVEKLSEEDAAYLADYRKMKQGQIGHMQITKVTQEQAKSVQVASAGKITEEAIDYFNKIDVSAPAPRKATSLASKISMLVNDTAATPRSQQPKSEKNTQSYLSSLKQASDERRNETRTIKVKLGDSLWEIAERAYGSGFDYPRIYAANPHLKNPDMIRIGEVLRVPL